jgi:recombination protein RecA
MDIVQKSGAWFSYNGDRLGQGRENAKQFLKDNPAVAEAIEKQVRESAKLVSGPSQGNVSDDDDEDGLDEDVE